MVLWKSVGLAAAAWSVGCTAAPGEAPESSPDESAENIVVTGERATRSLRDTPSSVEVFTADMLATMPGADRLDEVLEMVPNVTLGTGGLGPTIRGQDTTGSLQDLPAFLGGNKPRVTLQVDGRAVGFNEFVFGVAPTWDVQQVEVFRSPQSTTQGRNSIAGAIFVTTADPTYEWQAGGRVIAADFDTRQLSGVVSGPLVSDQLAFRLAGDFRRGSTSAKFGDNVAGANPNDDDFSLVRFKLLAEPNAIPGTRLELSYAHTASGTPGQLIRPPFENRANPLGVAGVFQTRVDALTASLGLQLDKSLRTLTTVSFGDSRIKRFPPPGLGRTKTDIRDLSFETVVTWKPEGAVRLLGGVHHLHTDLEQSIDLTAVIGFGEFDDRQRSTGLFGEVEWEPVQGLTITGGLRYQHDRQRRQGQLGDADFLLPIDFDQTYEAWLPKISVAYDLTSEVTAGFLVQRAYNPGGTTLNFDTGEQDVFGPETLWAYELFARASLAGGRVRLAANLFYNDIRDAQRSNFFPFSVPGGGTAFWADIDNVPKAETYGLEATADWRITTRLRVRGGLGLLKTRIVEPAETNPFLKGNDFSRSPPSTASGSIDWRPLDRLRLSASARHSRGYYSDDANTPARKVGRWTRIDARAAYDFGPATIFGYGRNLLDDFNMTFLNSTTLGAAMEPRELGIGLEARF